MLTIDKIALAMETAINKIKTPASILPSLLLYCTAMKRPGMSPSRIASQIIANNQSLGIETGDNPDGTPNVVNQYTYNIVKGIVDALKDEAVIHAVIPTGSVMIQASGVNGGGPVTCVGSNISDTTIVGLIR